MSYEVPGQATQTNGPCGAPGAKASLGLGGAAACAVPAHSGPAGNGTAPDGRAFNTPGAAGLQEGLVIQVNGTPQSTIATTLHDWVQAQGATPESVATALNGQFVPRSQRASTVLRAGDHILTFQPITGG